VSARGARAALAAAVCRVALATAAPGCSLVVDASTQQCNVTADCVALGPQFDGATCDARGHCVVPRACQVSEECPDSSAGGPSVCVASRCTPLFSRECRSVAGEATAPGALLFGEVLTASGVNSTLGLPARDAVQLAVSDFQRTAGGLPPAPGEAGRPPLAFVECDDGGDPEAAVRAARHLVGDLHVAGLIGPSTSGAAVQVATQVTVSGGTLLIAPSATSMAITDLQDDGLVWRTAPSDRNQIGTLANFMPHLEDRVRQELGMAAGDPVRVAILHKGDAYGVPYANALAVALSFNKAAPTDPINKGNFLQRNYGDPGDPSNGTNYDSVIADAVAFQPHVIMVPGTNEALTVVLKRLEDRWTSTRFRPRWILGSVGTYGDVGGTIGTNDELRGRVLGVVSGTTAANYKLFEAYYLSRVHDGTSPQSVGAANAYDAVYLLSYLTAGLANGLLTGHRLAEGIRGLMPGPGVPRVEVTPSEINNGLALLERVGRIDLDGSSGPLDFDLATGDTAADTQIYCISRDATGRANGASYSGWYLAAGSTTLTIPAGQDFPACP
jgi:ABC-type branched-subunit amino acid transport system substrate-binding protein